MTDRAPGSSAAARASAGRTAKEDLLVTLEGGADDLVVELQSSVARLYGDHITALVRATLGQLGVRGVRARVDDQGALDWVIQARVEAAARRLDPDLRGAVALPVTAGSQPGASAPAGGELAGVIRQGPSPGASARDRVRRSRLYLPGNQPDLMMAAALFQPDAIILDLEDAVAPAEKDAARILVRHALIAVDFGACERMVRINQGARGQDDLEAVVRHGVQTVLVPKVESPADLAAVAARILALSPGYPVWLMPIIETAAGVLRAFDIASCQRTVCALAFGAEDFTRDIGAPRTRDGRESFVARSLLVLAARAAGVQPIDTVYSDVEDEAGLLASTQEAISLGFDGKGCIHPRQVAVVHRAFRPTDAEVVYAVRVQRAIATAEAMGQGVIAIGSKMIDPPVVARALRVLKQAEVYRLDPQALFAAAEAARATAAG